MGGGGLAFGMSTRTWLSRAAATQGIEMIRISPEIAWESCHLPDTFHRDPADQIVVATAQILGLSLVTRDRRLLAYDPVRTVW